jgi:DNA-binding MarR family transcriptional regulator
MAKKLEGGERLVLTSLRDLQGRSSAYVEDTKVAAATGMALHDVRDVLETLEDKQFVERTRLTDGFSAYVTAAGRLALRSAEPIASSKPAAAGAKFTPVPPSATVTRSAPRAATQSRAGPIRLFYSYSHKDEKLRKQLENHLAILKRNNVILDWHDRKIGAGQDWKNELDTELESAEVVLLLVSPDFLASNYCYDIEMDRAIERHEAGAAMVVPVILRECDWQESRFARFQALPKDGKAITSWPNRDAAFTDVAKGIRKAVEAMTANPR